MAIFDELKGIARILQEIGKLDLYEKILEIQQQLLEMQNENSKLKEKNEELNEKLELKGRMVYENDAYWLINDDKIKDGPFCPTCWDNNKKLIHLVRQQPGLNVGLCHVCNVPFIGVYGGKA